MDDMDYGSFEPEESNSSKSPSHPGEDLSWEVLDCSDSDSRPASDTPFTQLSKQATDAGDWILQPDNDRDGDPEGPCLPVIESIQSLSALDDDDDKDLAEEQVLSREMKNGQSHHDTSMLSEPDSDRLTIDMSVSGTDLDTLDKLVLSTNPPVAENKDDPPARGETKDNDQESSSSSGSLDGSGGSNSNESSDENSNASETAQSRDESSRGTQQSEQCPRSPREVEDKDSKQADDCDNDETPGLVISGVKGNVTSDNDDDSPLPKSPNTTENETGDGKSAEDRKPDDPAKSNQIQQSEVVQNKPKKYLIVVDPEGPDYETCTTEHIEFQPGIIKLEHDEPKDAKAKSSTTPVSTPVSTNISTQASLSVGTALSTATAQQGVAGAAVNQPNMNMAYKAFQQQYHFGSRTILKSPPKSVPQFLVRHGGPRSRPSYIRLQGPQALQHIARLTAPGGGMPNQQRMISVLMDRNNANSNSALQQKFTEIMQAQPPGTLVNTGGPSGNPVKVLILPSQASGTALTQTNVQTASSGAPPMYSVTTSGAMGALSSVQTPSGNKIIAGGVPSTPELKNVAQNIFGHGIKQGAKSGKSKGQGGAKGGALKSQGRTSKSNKSSVSDISDSDSLTQNLNSTEERLKRRLLSKTNLIKEYHPSLSSGLGNVAFEFYSCHGCRDVFVNKSSLEYHRNRQSMHITYNCDPCRRTFTFSNKCQFRCHMLKHVQELKLIHKNLLDRISIKATQYSASKSKGHSEEMKGLDSIDLLGNLDIPAATKKTSRDNTSSKDSGKAGSVEDANENGSTLGLTIASVSSVSLGDHQQQEDQQIPPGPPPLGANNKQTLPPPLTISNAIPLTALAPAPPEMISSLQSVQPTIVHKLDAAKPINVPQAKPSPNPILPKGSSQASPMGPLAQPSPELASTKSDEKSPSTDANKATDSQLVPASPGGKVSSLPAPVQSTEGGNIYCTECKQTFTSYMKLQRHFNDADKPHPLRPPCCNVRLATECCVRAHMRTHQGQKPYVCSDCGECFRGDLKIFKKHTYNCRRVMLSAVIVFPCPRCQAWYSKINELCSHVRKTHSESYLKCNLCPMAFKSISSFAEHNANKHPGAKTDNANFTSIYKCPLCDSVFHDQRLKLEHLDQHMNNIYANQRVSFVCQLCQKLCYNYAMMRYHLKEKHQVSALGNMCDLCGVDAGATIKHLVAHQRKAHNTFPANMLVDPYSKSTDGEKSSDSDSTPAIKPKSVDHTTSKSDAIVSLDTKKEQTTSALPIKPKTGPEENGHHPSVPPPRELKIQPLKPGESGESGERVKCHLCGQYFPNRKILVMHKREAHNWVKRGKNSTKLPPVETTTPPSLPCPDEPPQKRARQEEELLDETTPQLQVRSNYMLRFECDDCDYRTPTFQDLQQHQADVHGIEARFPCLLCGITFHTMGRLDEHMKSTHEGQTREYPYLCWICEDAGQRKGYNKRAHLVRHFMNYHKVASKAIDSDRLDEMDKKAMQTESEKREDGNEQEGKAPKRPRIEGEDKFRCIKCDFECMDRTQFQDHIGKHKKGGADTYQCPECGMCFSVLPPLKNHLRLVHKIKNFNRYVENSGVKLTGVTSKLIGGTTNSAAPTGSGAGDDDHVKRSKLVPKKKSPGKNDNGTGSTDKNPLECTVCYRAFNDEVGLKKHMRSHGMAFIRSKRLAPMAFLAD